MPISNQTSVGLTTAQTIAANDYLSSNIKLAILDRLKNRESDIVRELYTVHAPDSGERKITFKSDALPRYSRRNAENELLKEAKFQEGDEITMEYFKFADSKSYSDESMKFDKYNMIPQFASNLVDSILATEELEMTHRAFTYDNVANYTPLDQSYTIEFVCTDGQPLISANHTVAATRADGVTYSNDLGTLEFKETNFITAVNRLQNNQVNDLGERARFKASHIVIPNHGTMLKRAFEILGTPTIPTVDGSAAASLQSDRTVNVFAMSGKMGLNLVVLDKGAEDAQGILDIANFGYKWQVVDMEWHKKNNKYATGGVDADVVKADDSFQMKARAKKYSAHVRTLWQGTVGSQGVAF